MSNSAELKEFADAGGDAAELTTMLPSSLVVEQQHSSTKYFSEKLRELASNTEVRVLEDAANGVTSSIRRRRLSPAHIQKLLKEQAPDLPVSQSQIYRYYHGDVSPRLDVVFELAKLFGVSPCYFVPGDTETLDAPKPKSPARRGRKPRSLSR